MTLPKEIANVIVPPIKCQGIKTKLVRFIAQNIVWQGQGKWIEPFLGSGVVLFNIRPNRALISDANPHLITFYCALYTGQITPRLAQEYLQQEGAKLLASETHGRDSYYYEVRERFNQTAAPLDFLFLSRACFNGLMRFNQQGAFNVPFCHKPDRFRPAYITKIVNQIKIVQGIMQDKDWEFVAQDWRASLATAEPNDFVYLDPPYIGRHTDYYNQWGTSEADALAQATQTLPCGFALSMWKANQYRTNDHLDQYTPYTVERVIEHHYHVGSTEDLRHPMQEVLLIHPQFATVHEYWPLPTAVAPHQLALLPT